MKTFLCAILIGLLGVTVLYAGVTVSGYSRYQVYEGGAKHYRTAFTLTMDSTGTSATTIPVNGIITHVYIKPGSTSPSANTLIKFLHPRFTDVDVLGGVGLLATTTGTISSMPYINGAYQWSMPVDGDITPNVTGNTKAGSSSVSVEFDTY